MKQKLTTIASLAALTGSAMAANIAGTGTGIIGYNSAIDTTLGTSYVRGDQDINRLTDGVTGQSNIGAAGFAAVQDTWNGQQTGTEFGYYGVTGLSIPGGEQITDLTVNLLLANDGGWFGPNGSGPGNGGALDATHLTVPTIQVSSDGGTTWSNVGASSNDYLTTLTGAALGFGGNPSYETVNFTLDTPQTGIDSIRLIGSAGGGPAGADQNGFVGVAEFEVNTNLIPEPTSLAFLGLSLIGLTRRSRK
ncbi:MAG: PEP-CTERM sorting domain-containing protein [Akkermansiaceae bacterium]